MAVFFFIIFILVCWVWVRQKNKEENVFWRKKIYITCQMTMLLLSSKGFLERSSCFGPTYTVYFLGRKKAEGRRVCVDRRTWVWDDTYNNIYAGLLECVLENVLFSLSDLNGGKVWGYIDSPSSSSSSSSSTKRRLLAGAVYRQERATIGDVICCC